jgi:hypothetical protein
LRWRSYTLSSSSTVRTRRRHAVRRCRILLGDGPWLSRDLLPHPLKSLKSKGRDLAQPGRRRLGRGRPAAWRRRLRLVTPGRTADA